MLTWLKLYEYAIYAANALGVPTVVVILALLYFGSSTQAQLEAHNTKTLEAVTGMQTLQTAILADAKHQQQEQYERMISFLRAICMNTASYDKNLMRECGKI